MNKCDEYSIGPLIQEKCNKTIRTKVLVVREIRIKIIHLTYFYQDCKATSPDIRVIFDFLLTKKFITKSTS